MIQCDTAFKINYTWCATQYYRSRRVPLHCFCANSSVWYITASKYKLKSRIYPTTRLHSIELKGKTIMSGDKDYKTLFRNWARDSWARLKITLRHRPGTGLGRQSYRSLLGSQWDHNYVSHKHTQNITHTNGKEVTSCGGGATDGGGGRSSSSAPGRLVWR